MTTLLVLCHSLSQYLLPFLCYAAFIASLSNSYFNFLILNLQYLKLEAWTLIPPFITKLFVLFEQHFPSIQMIFTSIVKFHDYMAVIRCTPATALCKLSPDTARGGYPAHMSREEFPVIFKYLCLQYMQRSINTFSLQPLLALRSLIKPRIIFSWLGLLSEAAMLPALFLHREDTNTQSPLLYMEQEANRATRSVCDCTVV